MLTLPVLAPALLVLRLTDMALLSLPPAASRLTVPPLVAADPVAPAKPAFRLSENPSLAAVFRTVST